MFPLRSLKGQLRKLYPSFFLPLSLSFLDSHQPHLPSAFTLWGIPTGSRCDSSCPIRVINHLCVTVLLVRAPTNDKRRENPPFPIYLRPGENFSALKQEKSKGRGHLPITFAFSTAMKCGTLWASWTLSTELCRVKNDMKFDIVKHFHHRALSRPLSRSKIPSSSSLKLRTRGLSTRSPCRMKHHLMVGTWTPPGAIFTFEFDDESLSLKLIKRTPIPEDEPISWMTFDVSTLSRME